MYTVLEENKKKEMGDKILYGSNYFHKVFGYIEFEEKGHPSALCKRILGIDSLFYIDGDERIITTAWTSGRLNGEIKYYVSNRNIKGIYSVFAEIYTIPWLVNENMNRIKYNYRPFPFIKSQESSNSLYIVYTVYDNTKLEDNESEQEELKKSIQSTYLDINELIDILNKEGFKCKFKEVKSDKIYQMLNVL